MGCLYHLDIFHTFLSRSHDETDGSADETGNDETGNDETGTDETGTDETSTAETGADGSCT